MGVSNDVSSSSSSSAVRWDRESRRNPFMTGEITGEMNEFATTGFRIVLGLRLRDVDRDDCDKVLDGAVRDSSLLLRFARNFFGGTCTNSSANAVLMILLGLPEGDDDGMIRFILLLSIV